MSIVTTEVCHVDARNSNYGANGTTHGVHNRTPKLLANLIGYETEDELNGGPEHLQKGQLHLLGNGLRCA
jgi:hypothetical protein